MTYVERSMEVYRTRGEAKLKPIIPPAAGLRADVRRAIRHYFPVLPREQGVKLVWRRLPPDRFFDLERDNRILVLNSRYRRAVLGNRRASTADAPLVKALLYLLVNDMFHTQRESTLERSKLEGYQAILVAAVRGEKP